MTPLGQWVFWAFVGGIVGYIVGRFQTATEETHRMAQETHRIAEGMHVDAPPDTSSARRKRRLEQVRSSWALWLLTLALILGVTSFTFSVNETRAREQTADTTRNTCRTDVLNRFLDAALDRQNQAAADGQARHDLNVKLATAFTIIAEPGATLDQKKVAFFAYLNALNDSNHAYDALVKAQDRHPFPTAEDVQACNR
jgi:hypothetical protein